MARGDFLAFPQQIMNPYEWEVRLACINSTNFANAQIAAKNSVLYQYLLRLGNQYQEFNQFSGDADAIFGAIFGGEGVKINPSLFDSGMTPSSRGSMFNFKATFEPGFFISEMDMEATFLVDLNMDFATQSYIAGVLSCGKAYLSSLKWYVRATRITNYAGLGEKDPFYSQAGIPELIDTTTFAYNQMTDQAKINEISTIFLGGTLVDVDAYAGSTKDAPTGKITLTGIYAVNHNPVNR